MHPFSLTPPAGETTLLGLQLPSDFSREALLDSVSENPTGVLEIDEFGGFLARASRDYMSGVKTIGADNVLKLTVTVS